MRKFFGLVALALAAPAAATVPSTTSTAGPYACNGVTTVFSAPFRFFANSDLVVTKKLTATGAEIALTMATDYTVQNTGTANGGTVTLVAGSKCPAGYTLAVKRTLPLTQTTSLGSTSQYTPGAQEILADKGVALAQQIVRDQNARDAAQDLALSLGAVGGNDAFITSRGSTTARKLTDRFAELGNAQDYSYDGPAMLAGITAAAPTAIASSLNTPQFWLRRVDNSPPTSGATILNPWLAPAWRFDLLSQSGTVTGSHTGLLISMPSVNGKSVTTTTAAIVGRGTRQSVPVVDSSVFTVGETATIDMNQGSAAQESVTITAVPDGTHVTGVFTHSHSPGAQICVNGKGDKIGLGVAMSNTAANTSGTYGSNINVIGYQTGGRAVVGQEIDLTNQSGRPPGMFYGDRNGPAYIGQVLYHAGPDDATSALAINTQTSAAHWRIGIDIEDSSQYGMFIGNLGGHVNRGISIFDSVAEGLVIGSNQTSPTISVMEGNDPTVGIRLTAKVKDFGLVNARSNVLRLEEIAAGVTHNWDVQAIGSQLSFNYDAVKGPRINTNGGLQVHSAFYLRSTDNSTVADWTNSGGTGVLTTAVVRDASTGAAANGAIRLTSGNSLQFRNAAGTGDVMGLSKTAGDVVVCGGTRGMAPPATTFATLGTPANGTMFYCSDCTVANPCAGAGTGAIAKRLNGGWVCN